MFFPVGTPVCRQLRQDFVIFESGRLSVDSCDGRGDEQLVHARRKPLQIFEGLEDVSITNETGRRPTPDAFPRNSWRV